MDIMLILQIIVLLGAIFLGVRLGGIGIGYAGGAGVLVLGLILGMEAGQHSLGRDSDHRIGDRSYFGDATRRRSGLYCSDC